MIQSRSAHATSPETARASVWEPAAWREMSNPFRRRRCIRLPRLPAPDRLPLERKSDARHDAPRGGFRNDYRAVIELVESVSADSRQSPPSESAQTLEYSQRQRLAWVSRHARKLILL